ncbi:hypothetical protein SNE40_022392 [Patella caerulea]|uniref:Uncharacterized protein n=1 Tax=Patella caerulea TaxID=87958 RepID=A0AAN8IZK8_PATCE
MGRLLNIVLVVILVLTIVYLDKGLTAPSRGACWLCYDRYEDCVWGCRNNCPGPGRCQYDAEVFLYECSCF